MQPDRNKGVTLIELLLAITIMVILGFMASILYTQLQRFLITHMAKLALQNEERFILPLISNRIREADPSTIYIDNVNGQPIFSKIKFTTDVDDIEIEIYQTDRLLYLTMDAPATPKTTQILTKNLREIVFNPVQSDTRDTISVMLSLEKNGPKGKPIGLRTESRAIKIKSL